MLIVKWVDLKQLVCNFENDTIWDYEFIVYMIHIQFHESKLTVSERLGSPQWMSLNAKR